MGNVVVADAGTAAANDTYTETGLHNGKYFHNSAGSSPSENAVSWNSGDLRWEIFCEVESFQQIAYWAPEDVPTPGDVVEWQVAAGADPVPTVTGGTEPPTSSFQPAWAANSNVVIQ